MNELRLRIKLEGKDAKEAGEDTLDHLKLEEEEQDTSGMY